MRPHQLSGAAVNAFDTIELPVIALLAGLMVLAGFMEHLGAFDSLAYFIQHPLCLCTCTCTCLSTPCHRRRRRGRGAARPSGFDYAQYTSATPAPLTAAGTSDGGGGSCGCGGGRKLDQAQARQCKQIAKNALVLVVLACMTTLFLLGPLIKANVGATAFGTALVCLIGLGITSARSAQHDTTAAAGDRTTRAITRAVIEQAQATLLRGTIFADRDSQSGQWSTSQQSGGNFTHHRMSSLVKSQTSEQQGGTDECCVGAPPHGSGQHGEVKVQEDEEEDEEEDAIIMGGEGAAAAIDGAAVRPLGRAGTIVMLCLVSGGLSSLIMNDTVALVFAPMIVSKLQGVDDRFPYLLALATAVDIGSTLTSVGNPQNNLVSIFSGLEFTIFVKFMALPVFVAMAILIVMLLWWPWKELSAAEQPPRGAERRRSEQTTATRWPSAADQIGYRPTATPPAVVGAAGSVAGAGRQPLEISLAAPGPGGPGAAGAELDVEGGEADVEEAAAAAAAVAGSAGGPLPQAASARRVREDKLTPAFLQNHIDVPLLLLFTGQFIMVQGLVDTGVPKCVWEAAMPADPLESVGDCATFVCAIVLLSNMISNVPLMLLVRPMLSELMLKDPAEAKAAWLVIAFASTMAGNLTLIGSASNLIVANNAQEEERKQARAQRRPESSSLFPAARHARFGIPLTLLTCGAGVSILYLELKVWGWSVCDSSAEQGCV
jgi:Na+/H+ antiporter NhaD/arsenite permease-like protein